MKIINDLILEGFNNTYIKKCFLFKDSMFWLWTGKKERKIYRFGFFDRNFEYWTHLTYLEEKELDDINTIKQFKEFLIQLRFKNTEERSPYLGSIRDTFTTILNNLNKEY